MPSPRKLLRKALHEHLDLTLNGTSIENGREVNALDALVERAAAGFLINVRIEAIKPDDQRVRAAMEGAQPSVRRGPGLVS